MEYATLQHRRIVREVSETEANHVRRKISDDSCKRGFIVSAQIGLVALVIFSPLLVGRSADGNTASVFTGRSNDFLHCTILRMNSAGAVFVDGKPFDPASVGSNAAKHMAIVVLQVETSTPLPAISNVLEQLRLRGLSGVRISVVE
jgi:hypothetical protein